MLSERDKADETARAEIQVLVYPRCEHSDASAAIKGRSAGKAQRALQWHLSCTLSLLSEGMASDLGAAKIAALTNAEKMTHLK